jgi:transposase
LAVPTLEQLTGFLTEWPSEDERDDTATWLEFHANEADWAAMAEFSRSSRLFRLRDAQHLHPDYLVHALTPPELLAAWEDVAGSAPTDLTDDEWALLVQHLGQSRNRYGAQPRSARELQAKRRIFNAIRFKMAHGLRWSQLPSRYGQPLAATLAYRSYQTDGLFRQLYQALRDDEAAPDLAAWLKVVIERHHDIDPPGGNNLAAVQWNPRKESPAVDAGTYLGVSERLHGG